MRQQMIKPITIFLLLMPLLSMAADKNELSAIDKKATALETQLNKSLDTSPDGAKVMIELVDLYYNEGRVFGLVRVAKALPRHHCCAADAVQQRAQGGEPLGGWRHAWRVR